MKEQLPKEEIEKLFAFVESKNVPCKDVQYEIVDHLATAIEDLKAENPEWTYDLCLHQVYKKFPITGFALLQMEIEESLKKYWKRKLWPYLLQYFKLPKIIITLAIFLGLQQVFNSMEPIELPFYKLSLAPNYFVYILIFSVFAIITSIYSKKLQSKKIKLFFESSKKEELQYVKSFNEAARLLTTSITVIPVYLSSFNINGINEIIFHGFNSYLLAWFILGMLLHIHLILVVFPPILRKEAKEKYSHIHMKIA